jgi:hypothetical protein
MADAAPSSPHPSQQQRAACAICYAAPASVLSLACGHAVLCPACCAQLRAREEREACPVCCTPLAYVASAEDFQLAGDASFVPPQPRLLVIMELLRNAQGDQADGDDEEFFGIR